MGPGQSAGQRPAERLWECYSKGGHVCYFKVSMWPTGSCVQLKLKLVRSISSGLNQVGTNSGWDLKGKVESVGATFNFLHSTAVVSHVHNQGNHFLGSNLFQVISRARCVGILDSMALGAHSRMANRTLETDTKLLLRRLHVEYREVPALLLRMRMTNAHGLNRR